MREKHLLWLTLSEKNKKGNNENKHSPAQPPEAEAK